MKSRAHLWACIMQIEGTRTVGFTCLWPRMTCFRTTKLHVARCYWCWRYRCKCWIVTLHLNDETIYLTITVSIVSCTGPPVMILEHCSKGSLLDWLRAFRDGGPSAVCTSIDWHQDGTEGNINTTIPSTLQHSRVLHERVGPISSGDDTDAEDAKYYNYRQKESSGNNNTASAFAEGDHLEPSKESSTPGASNSLPNSVMIRFAYQIASGMETLAAENVSNWQN